MRCVVGFEWGADREALLHIYRALMRATLDYGCMMYETAAKSHLEKLDRIQYKALKGLYVTFRNCLLTMTPVAVKSTAVSIRLLAFCRSKSASAKTVT